MNSGKFVFIMVDPNVAIAGLRLLANLMMSDEEAHQANLPKLQAKYGSMLRHSGAYPKHILDREIAAQALALEPLALGPLPSDGDIALPSSMLCELAEACKIGAVQRKDGKLCGLLSACHVLGNAPVSIMTDAERSFCGLHTTFRLPQPCRMSLRMFHLMLFVRDTVPDFQCRWWESGCGIVDPARSLFTIYIEFARGRAYEDSVFIWIEGNAAAPNLQNQSTAQTLFAWICQVLQHAFAQAFEFHVPAPPQRLLLPTQPPADHQRELSMRELAARAAERRMMAQQHASA
jgi:hypothetical protein